VNSCPLLARSRTYPTNRGCGAGREPPKGVVNGCVLPEPSRLGLMGKPAKPSKYRAKLKIKNNSRLGVDEDDICDILERQTHGVYDMKTANGNDKLGKENCLVVSRPVGDTCPSTCAFLGNGCYAENLEKIYPGVRPAGMQNLITERGRIRSMMIMAESKGKAIRWHERGDFFINGELDNEYVDNIIWACDSILADGGKLPEMWFYTHIYDSKLAGLSKYMAAYASIHNSKDMADAKAAGFTLFAWCDSDEKIAPVRPRGKVKAQAWRDSLPKLVVLEDEKFVTCPEIRRGRGVVTCTPSKKSVACNLCVKGLANVLFPSH